MLKHGILFILILFSSLIFAQGKFNQVDSQGEKHGPWRIKYKGTDQLRFEGTFEHGKEKGLFKFYKEDSKKQPAATKLFTEGSDLVEVKFFTKEGALVSEGTMKGEERQGKWIYYHNKSDQVMMIENYKDDILEGKKVVYFGTGKLAEEADYKNGKLNGVQKIYSKDGVLIKEFTYANNELHGPVKYYDSQGNLTSEGKYKNNLRDGNWKYYQNGKLSETRKYPEAFRSEN